MLEGCSHQKNNKPKPNLTDTLLTDKLNRLLENNIFGFSNQPHDNEIKNYSFVNSQNYCENCECEVTFLKEWLILHLDLIQQQDVEITTKENLIRALIQEIQMLREHLTCVTGDTVYSRRTVCETMNQDVPHIEDDTTLIYSCTPSKTTTMKNCLKNCRHLKDMLSFNNSVIHRPRLPAPCDIDEIASNLKKDTDDKPLCTLSNNSVMKQNKNEVNYQDGFPVRVRRKRLCSSSSAFSNNTSLEDKQPTRKRRRKRSTVIKDERILRCSDPYVTQASEIDLLSESSDANHIEIPSNLEVPKWRTKVYTSLYSMEGTEDLDNEVFNKRHMRLEIDERRRKKWDVQRIRELRVMEKLKLRQERVSGGSTSDKSKSLWPTLEDIKYVEVCDELPVSAFGTIIPLLPASEFSLPWVTNLVEPKCEVLEPEQPEPNPQPQQRTVINRKRPRRTGKRRKRRRRSSKR